MKWKYEHIICNFGGDVFMRVGENWGCDFHSCNKHRVCYFLLEKKSCFYLIQSTPIVHKVISSIPLVVLIDEEVVK